MKRVLIIGLGLVVVVGVVLAVWGFEGGDEMVVSGSEVGGDGVGRSGGCDGGGYSAVELYACLRNATILVPGAGLKTGFAFRDGRSTVMYGSGVTDRAAVRMLDDVYQQSGEHLAVVFEVHTGGTGVFYWLGSYWYYEDDSYFALADQVLLGDRVQVNYLRMDDDVLRVGVMQHGEGQSYSEELSVANELRFTFDADRGHLYPLD